MSKFLRFFDIFHVYVDLIDICVLVVNVNVCIASRHG